MLSLLRRVFSSGFIRANSLFFFAALLVGALNYLYYPVLGRMLAPAAFGEVQTLVSLFLQFTAFLSGLSVLAVTLVANARQNKETQAIIIEFERVALVASAGLLLASMAFSPMLQRFFHFETALPFVALALALVVSVPFTFRSAYLRGKKQFGRVAAGNVILAASKLLCSALLVAIGLGTVGAVGGLVLAQVLALACVAYWAWQRGLHKIKWSWPSLQRLRPHVGYAGAVLVVSSLITVQYSIDIVLVKHFFAPHEAGLYAGIATVARIVFFLTASITQVMLPSVVIGNAQNGQLLKKSLALFALVTLPALVLCSTAPVVVMTVLLGGAYSSYAWLLPPLALAMAVIALLQLLTSYFVALKQYGVVAVVVVGSAVTVWLMATGSHSLQALVTGLLAGSVCMLGLLLFWQVGTKLQTRYI